MKLTGKGKTTVERVAELAVKLGGRHLADYGATRSRHDFTQRQLMACLILRAYLKTTYRGVLELLAVSPNLREALGMQGKLPHYTTLQKFSARSQVLAIADAMIRTIGRAAGAAKFAQASAAMDATGMETTTASAHFQSRAGRTRRKWVKVSTIVLGGSLLPLSLVLLTRTHTAAVRAVVPATKCSTSFRCLPKLIRLFLMPPLITLSLRYLGQPHFLFAI